MAPEPTPVLCSLGSDLGLFSRASLEGVPSSRPALFLYLFLGCRFFTQPYLSIRSHLLCVLGVRKMFWIAAGTLLCLLQVYSFAFMYCYFNGIWEGREIKEFNIPL